jgi:probable F420-dependent oxidoreductase
LATGIASIYARDSLATKNAQYGLAELSDGRFLLGLGVSHAPMVEGVRGHRYEKPLATMKAYLERMATTPYDGPQPQSRPLTVLGALGPGMLELAATLADGAHPCNVPPEHTARAREILGPNSQLCPEQKILLERSPSRARAIARQTLSGTLGLPNYRNNLLRLGFSEEDCDHGGSDMLIDALVAWGDEDAIRNRIQQHWDAGADHVCIHSLPQHGGSWSDADEKIFELLAPAT